MSIKEACMNDSEERACQPAEIRMVVETISVEVPRGLAALLASNAKDAGRSFNDYVSALLVNGSGRR